MTRGLISLIVSGLVVGTGILTAWVQCGNYACAGELDELQLESQWFDRRSSELREELERFEFEAVLEDTLDLDSEPVTRGSERGAPPHF